MPLRSNIVPILMPAIFNSLLLLLFLLLHDTVNLGYDEPRIPRQVVRYSPIFIMPKSGKTQRPLHS